MPSASPLSSAMKKLPTAVSVGEKRSNLHVPLHAVNPTSLFLSLVSGVHKLGGRSHSFFRGSLNDDMATGRAARRVVASYPSCACCIQ